MIKHSLQAKLLLVVTLVIVVTSSVMVWIEASSTREYLYAQADEQMAESLSESNNLLTLTNALVSARLQTAIKILMKEGEAAGPASLGEPVAVNGRRVPDLLLGGEGQANRFDLVDRVTRLAGGTATLFVRDGSDFVRVSTNVMSNGRRAVGTVLDPRGKVISLIRRGDSFFGEVDILGKPYLTAYVPIFNARNEVIGIWYTGYEADLTALDSSLSGSHILTRGGLVVLDSNDRPLMHSDHLQKSTVQSLVDGDAEGWEVGKRSFDPWGFTVLAAYPRDEVAEAVRDTVLEITLVNLGACVAMLLTLYFFSERLVLRPIRGAMELAKNIANGHYNNTIQASSKDEISLLLISLEKMQTALRHFIVELDSASSQVAGSAEHLMSASNNTLQYVMDQRSRSDQMAAAMTEMSASVGEVAGNAARAAEAAEAVDQAAGKGRSVVIEAVSAIESLADEMDTVGQVVTSVALETTNIGGVVDVIRGIAEQTNLLALNAAIEAARAGEQGRGFAVVADEVRSLASRTQNSTDEIQQMIQRLQHSAARAEEQVRSSQGKAQQSVTHSNRVAEALHDIAHSVTQINDMITQVAAATEQQSVVSESVHKNIIEITEIADSTSQSAQTSNTETDKLRQLANDLRSLLRQQLH